MDWTPSKKLEIGDRVIISNKSGIPDRWTGTWQVVDPSDPGLLNLYVKKKWSLRSLICSIWSAIKSMHTLCTKACKQKAKE